MLQLRAFSEDDKGESLLVVAGLAKRKVAPAVSTA